MHHHPLAIAARRLLIVLLVAFIAASGGALEGCGDDEASPRSERAATSTPSASKPATDPTGNTYDASSEPHDARIEIAIKDIAFKPQYITARLGQTLVFSNRDHVAHKIRGQEGQYYTSKLLTNGDTFEYRIKQDPQLKNMAFICTIHPEKMRGGVVVTR